MTILELEKLVEIIVDLKKSKFEEIDCRCDRDCGDCGCHDCSAQGCRNDIMED